MHEIALSGGELDYRIVDGDEAARQTSGDAPSPTVVFVHGLLVDGALWDDVAERLAKEGITSVIPNWPLGSHTRPWGSGELSPDSLAKAIGDLCGALDLERVVLVGSDTGGALCQLALRDPSPRIAGLVLTNCDGFEVFPPKWFVPLFHVARYRFATWLLMQNTRLRAIRHSSLAYGRLLNHPLPAALTKRWVQPALHDKRIRRDINRFTRAYRGDELVESASWLGRFQGPVELVWGTRDQCFTPELGRRIAAALSNAPFVEIDSATTFCSVDAPDTVAAAISRVVGTVGGVDAASHEPAH